MSLPLDFAAELRKRFRGDIRLDAASRILYSTDASIYQIEPLGVAIPRIQDDLQAAVELAAHYRVPILARGAGTSLAGQAIGPALILDCSRWLNHVVNLDPASGTATVEPGVVLDELNRLAGPHGLQFGPDPASGERATMGGIVANNGTGAHSIRYGMAADHLLSADVLLSDGTPVTLRESRVPGDDPSAFAGASKLTRERPSRYDALLAAALEIRSRLADDVQSHFPASWRSSAGYRLNYLLGWSPSAPPEWVGQRYPANLPPQTLNMAHLLAGSEGTLAVIRQMNLALVPKPAHTVLAILQYPSLGAACDAVPDLLRHHPSAIELISQLLLRLAQNVPAALGRMQWVRGDPQAVIVMEFAGDDPAALRQQVAAVSSEAVVLESSGDQANVWAVRKIGLGLLDSRPHSTRPISFVEDCAIPVDRLGTYVRGMERIMRDHAAFGGIYGHASAGCLHIRPVLDLRTGEGRHSLRLIAEETAGLALSLGGSMTSEHGDGIARAEWLGPTYGPEIAAAMRQLKRAADPDGILNPGKKLDAPPLDQNLRYGDQLPRLSWQPGFNFDRHGGLTLAIERCNGQGVCRKESGVMCPSFQATRDEMYSTRGRANLLRALIGTGLPSGALPGDSYRRFEILSPEITRATFQALDLCLACKGCKAECPSGVDMAALKAEFLRAYYQAHRRPIRDYLFGYFHITARLLSAMAPLVNAGSSIAPLRVIMSRFFGIASQRPFPKFATSRLLLRQNSGKATVLFLRDPFNHYIDRQVEQAALDLLAAAGSEARILKSMGAGASLISKGFFASARQHATRLLAELKRVDPGGEFPLLAIEPSELSALHHEMSALLPDQPEADLRRVERSQSVEQYLGSVLGAKNMRVANYDNKVLFHPHCHQKADDASAGLDTASQDPSLAFLRGIGFEVELVQAGCCGMAGTFGYEDDHYKLSRDVGELLLFPRLRANRSLPVAATGAACRMQIVQGTGIEAQHPLVLAARALGLHSGGS